LADRLPMKWIRRGAALLFFIFGLLILLARPSAAFASDAGSASGFWVGELDAPQGFVLLGHGLNLKPSKMRSIAEAICNSESGLACRIIQLPGHEEQAPQSMKTISGALWKKALSSEVDQVSEMASRRKVPVYFLGYSLGGLMGEWALLGHEQSPFKKMVLIAPALSAYLYARAVVCLPLTNGVILPSKNHLEYRVHSGTSLGAYRAMFSIMKEVRKSGSKRLDIPTLIFTNPADELVDAEELKRWAVDSSLSKWEFVSVPALESKLKPVYQHLMIDSDTMGDGAFTFLSSRIREFLN
ncbi:MAG: alpha/beta hydrolase, partial [Bdellovibrionales bacterium]|nr:alpha/beta hydrolase [Bdellovibrionales bacterium]